MKSDQSHQKIKELLKELQSEGKEILTKWDAGGDETLVYLRLEGQNEVNEKLEEISEALEDIIIDTLELPNAGEYFHNGDGKISLNDQGEIVLNYTSKELCYENYTWEDGKLVEEDNQIESHHLPAMQLDDPFDMAAELHRLEFMLEGEMDPEFNIQTSMNINTIQGDEFILSEEMKSFYQSQIQAVLEEQIPGLKSEEKKITSLQIEGQLQPNHSVQFRITKNAIAILSIHNDKRILLIS